MDDKRRQELYAQLRAVLMELLYDKQPFIVDKVERDDGSVLNIRVSETVGMRERMM